jgi:hypothetical protein
MNIVSGYLFALMLPLVPGVDIPRWVKRGQAEAWGCERTSRQKINATTEKQ